MPVERKFYEPILRTYNDNLSKRWRIEWWIPSPGGGRRCPRPVYGNINKGVTVEERKDIAEHTIKSLSLKPTKRKKDDLFSRIIDARRLRWKPKTISSYTTVADQFTVFLRKTKVEAATPLMINNFLLHIKDEGVKNKKRKKGASTNTIAKYRDVLYTLYKAGNDLGLCKVNPVTKESKIKRSPQSLFFFTDLQISLFKEYEMSRQLWLGIQFLFYTFIRPGEQRHMRISWINFEYQFIEVPSEFSKNGKTQKVSIPDSFLAILSFLKEYPNNFYILSKNGYPGTEQISEKWLNDEHRKVLKALKITGNYALYSWKHTGAVKAVKAGINIKDLQLQLRHHSLDMVNEYLKNLGVLHSEDLRKRYPVL